MVLLDYGPWIGIFLDSDPTAGTFMGDPQYQWFKWLLENNGALQAGKPFFVNMHHQIYKDGHWDNGPGRDLWTLAQSSMSVTL